MYSRSAKGGEKGDPKRNPWLAKMIQHMRCRYQKYTPSPCAYVYHPRLSMLSLLFLYVDCLKYIFFIEMLEWTIEWGCLQKELLYTIIYAYRYSNKQDEKICYCQYFILYNRNVPFQMKGTSLAQLNHIHLGDKVFHDLCAQRHTNRNYSAILATLQITSYALGV